MAKAKRDPQRERRIQQEIVVDAHDAQEQAMGWYYYLEEQLRFPFPGKCIAQRAISPLHRGQEVEVVGLAPAEECEHERFVMVTWEQPTLAVPLAQLEAIPADKATQQAVEDWH
jgi:hypothetical protein